MAGLEYRLIRKQFHIWTIQKPEVKLKSKGLGGGPQWQNASLASAKALALVPELKNQIKPNKSEILGFYQGSLYAYNPVLTLGQSVQVKVQTFGHCGELGA